MFKRTMTFDNLEGEEVSQTFYFNYNKKEIAELLEFKQLEKKLKLLSMPVEESGLSQQENNQQAYDIFQDLILDAFGQKGADNVTFSKTPELRAYWASHVAFVELIFEFLEKPQLAAEFIENCLPTKMVAKAKEEMQKENDNKLSSESLAEMVEEANRRQENPDTRVEPGLPAAVETLKPSPEIVQAAQGIAGMDAPRPTAVSDGAVKAKKQEDLTENDILTMDDVAFAKLLPQRFSNEQMVAAFRRKMQN